MKKYIEPIIHLSIWLIGYLLILEYVNTILDFRKDGGPFWLSILFGTLINQFIFYTVAFWLIPHFLPKRNILGLIMLLIGGLIGINLLETVIDFYYLAKLKLDSSDYKKSTELNNRLSNLCKNFCNESKKLKLEIENLLKK